ncbi:MAG: DUF2019 domain-containing protein [Thermoflavifilum sp.]|nr:DUF2019 domain-containing protein [Thermoflavifilum sp.]MCL6513773.1 DUF2019 domain-containing protein [Alicyclobacillus sp.]
MLFDLLSTIRKDLENRNQLALLLTLLDHHEEEVRLMAAAHTLSVDSERAAKTLAELSRSPRVGFTARMTLEEWKRTGNLRF